MIHSLFPIPIGFYSLERDFTTTELDLLLNQETRPNTGNTTSLNSYMLKNTKLKKLKQFFDESLADYFTRVYSPKYQVGPKITQSWINYTKTNEWHHRHSHPNSFISGVFYIQSDEIKDRIYFFRKNQYKQIEFVQDSWNEWNSESWWFQTPTKQLILFPSSLEHAVEPVTAEQTRISLSFNTFLYGQLGDETQLTELITKE